jgi:hypothetical protein
MPTLLLDTSFLIDVLNDRRARRNRMTAYPRHKLLLDSAEICVFRKF